LARIEAPKAPVRLLTKDGGAV